MTETSKRNCLFCQIAVSDARNRIVEQNDHAFYVEDGHPVTQGHILIVPKRHIGSFFETTQEEKLALLELLDKARIHVESSVNTSSYTIGINDGPFAGQTVPHLHIHFIPRYEGDVSDPRGGVRWVVPERADYWT